MKRFAWIAAGLVVAPALAAPVVAAPSAAVAQTSTSCRTTAPGSRFAGLDCEVRRPGELGRTTHCHDTFLGRPEMGITCDDPAPSLSSGNGEGTAAAAAAVAVGVGALIAGVKAHNAKAAAKKEELLQQNRANRVAALAAKHDCAGAKALALAEKDGEMAGRVDRFCLTTAQAGEEPAFLPAAASGPEVMTWMQTHLRMPKDARVVSANRDEIVWIERLGPSPGTVWLHNEVLSDAGRQNIQGRSALMLQEASCADGRLRMTASTLYLGSNLTGMQGSSDKPGDWAATRPGSKGQLWYDAACAAWSRTETAGPPPAPAATTRRD